MKYTPQNNFVDVLDFLRFNNIKYLNFVKNNKIQLKLKKNLTGGDVYSKDYTVSNKYNVLIDEYDDKNIKLINFIKLNAELDVRGDYKEDDHCGILIIDKIQKKASIQSVNNYKECLKCIKGDDYKIGDILMRIMLMVCKENNIKVISLTDNSYLLCYEEKIPLIYLRTMTKGEPYYCKFGFIPKSKNDYKIFEQNKQLFLNNPQLSKEEFINLFMYRKFNENNKNDKKMLTFINNMLIPRLKSINNVSEILKIIIDYKMNIGCYLLLSIYMKLYDLVGYSHYNRKNFYLKL